MELERKNGIYTIGKTRNLSHNLNELHRSSDEKWGGRRRFEL